MKALTAAQMRDVDRLTNERYGISGLRLMEAAGQRLCDVLLRELDRRHGPDARNAIKISILCGKGNNGGDGLVVARHLKVAGIEARVYLFGDPAKLTGDSADNVQRWKSVAGAVEIIADEVAWNKARAAIEKTDVIVDALLGTGLRGAATGTIAAVIAAVNDLSHNTTAARPSLILAVDIPSGLPSDGEPAEGPVLQAHKTVTFTAPKVGQLVSRDAAAGGALEVWSIGSPAELVDELGDGAVRWANASEFASLPLVRPADSNKGTFGHVLLVAGSLGKSGAAILGGRMALRAGAGLVTVATPEPVLPIVAAAQAEYMTVPLAATVHGTVALSSVQGDLWKQIEKGKTVLALGPGMGADPETQESIRSLVRTTELPTVLDADGLNAFDERPDELRDRKSTFLAITPHPGEMARLLSCTTREVQEDRLKSTLEAAKRWNAHVILKGFHTILAAPDGAIFVNSTGNPGLAKGGTGDVLTGLLAALTAQFKTEDWLRVLAMGVFLHGLAADLMLEKMDASGMLADDLIVMIPQARAQLLQELQRIG